MKKGLKKLYVFLIFVFMYAPIVVMMIYSFNNFSEGRKTIFSAEWKGFTLKWYKALGSNPQMTDALYVTLFVAVVSAIVATVIGTLAAIGIHNMKKIPKKAVLNITNLPVLNPDIVTGISLLILFVFARIKLGTFSMLLAHITFNIPYVIISVLPKLSQLNKNMYEAALDLGAPPLYTYRKIILPEIMPGILTGFLFAVTLSIDDFVVSFFTSNTDNLSMYIYSSVSKNYNPSINALSTIMFIVIFVLLLLVNIRSSKDSDKNNEKQKEGETLN